MNRTLLGLCAMLLACATTPSSSYASARVVAGSATGGYSLEVIDEYGRQLPTYALRGRTYVLGNQGARYQIRVRNHTPRRIEAVVSVDGRDAIDGKQATTRKRGYIVSPYGEVSIDGFRVSMESVATFRFSSVADSYAGRMGDARDVGVIGVAVYTEYQPPVAVVPMAPSYGQDEQYDPGARDFDMSQPSRRAEGARKSPEPGPAPAPPATQPPSRSEGRLRGAMDKNPATERPGLGTEFGEQRDSRVTLTEFQRARPRPDVVLQVRYNDHDGLLALGIPVDGPADPMLGELYRRETAHPFADVPRSSGFSTPPPGWNR
jgi:hypothetical protein